MVQCVVLRVEHIVPKSFYWKQGNVKFLHNEEKIYYSEKLRWTKYQQSRRIKSMVYNVQGIHIMAAWQGYVISITLYQVHLMSTFLIGLLVHNQEAIQLSHEAAFIPFQT